jgi:hypothetical protein
MFFTKELIDEIDENISSACFDRVKILRGLNKALFAIASVDDIYLPDLAVEGRLLSSFVGRNYTTLPADYHKKITSVLIDNAPVPIYASLSRLKEQFNGLTDAQGKICGVATQGNKLYYQKVPSDKQSIKIGYYRKPEEMIDVQGDSPEGAAGSGYFYECLVSHAIWKFYSAIEDGIEGPMSNTAYYKNEFYENLDLLRNFCHRDAGPDTVVPTQVPFQLFTY